MNNNNSNENLRNKINHHERSINRLKTQGFSRNFAKSHINYHQSEITALKRELNRRTAARRAKAQGRWKTLRGHVGARGIVRYLQKAAMRPPNAGGAGYRRMARQTNVGKKRTRSVGTSMSPRRSPKRRNAGTSP